MTTIKRIGILRETIRSHGFTFVPGNISNLKDKFEVIVEEDTGICAGYSDDDYLQAGACDIVDRDTLLDRSDVLISFDPPDKLPQFDSKKAYIGFYNAMNEPEAISSFIGKGADVYSLDLMPRTSLAQSMDILSSLASVSGYKAVITAAELSPKVMPMITSAGGTLKPASFLILGAGVAGLQAIATAKRLGAMVTAFDVRKAAKIEVQSLGAKFIEMEGAVDRKSAGGYAVEQDVDYLESIVLKMIEIAENADVIIATAKIPGKKAPRLITAETVERMKPGSVIIDLAADTGGNCALTRKNEIIDVNGVKIVGLSALWERCSFSLSHLVSNNLTSFLNHYHLHADKENEDEILRSTKLMEAGQIILPQFTSSINNY